MRGIAAEEKSENMRNIRVSEGGQKVPGVGTGVPVQSMVKTLVRQAASCSL